MTAPACCPDGCVVCEVDGLPMDAQRFAERQEMDRQSRDAFDRAIVALERPRPPVRASALVKAPPMTARQRGAARSARIAAEASAETFTAGMGWTLHATGLSDRRDSGSVDRMRTGRALGRVKKQRRAGQDV